MIVSVDAAKNRLEKGGARGLMVIIVEKWTR